MLIGGVKDGLENQMQLKRIKFGGKCAKLKENRNSKKTGPGQTLIG